MFMCIYIKKKVMDKNILSDLTHQLPLLYSWLERDKKRFSSLSLREWIYMEKERNIRNMEVIKCYSCKRPDPSVLLRQAPSITRCADELIESHHLCDQCYGGG